MLNTIILEVLDEVLEGEVLHKVSGCFVSKFTKKIVLKLVTNHAMPYTDFIDKTKNIILESDIDNYDEDADYLEVAINLTDEIINNVINYAKNNCFNELEEMKINL